MVRLRLFECLALVGAAALGVGILEYFAFSAALMNLDSYAQSVRVAGAWAKTSSGGASDDDDNEEDDPDIDDDNDDNNGDGVTDFSVDKSSSRSREFDNTEYNEEDGAKRSHTSHVQFDISDFSLGYRGWHQEARKRDYLGTKDTAASVRRSQRPFSRPHIEDADGAILPFDESLVLPKWREEPRLVYDVTVIRLRDAFRLIDDEVSLQDWEDIFSRVITIYARYNIYLRVSRTELANAHMLDDKRSLDYLAYVEGPDLAEVTTIGSTQPQVSLARADVQFSHWVTARYKKLYGLQVLESASKLPKGLKALMASTDKYNFQRNMLEWIVGYPMRVPPWNLVNSSPIFPVFYFHMRNGECFAGRIFGRTGSCYERRKPIIDPDTGAFLRNATCRRFENALKTRAARPVQRRVHEKVRMRGDTAARMLAHELGHNFGEHHPSDSCALSETWEKGNLMHQLRYVGIASRRVCPDAPLLEQSRATSLSAEQVTRMREAIQKVDIKPSGTVPGGITVGRSTMQLGSASKPLADVFRQSRRAYIAAEFELTRKAPCSLHQHIVVLNLLPAPKAGRVARVRWMPAHPYTKAAIVEIYVVEPRRKSLAAPAGEMVDFSVKQRSGPLVLPHEHQWFHKELDLPDAGLSIEKGQFIAIARLDGNGLDIDQALHASDAVLFSDVAGQLGSYYDTIHDALSPEHLPDTSTYPRVAFASKQVDSFYYAADPPLPGHSGFRAHAAPPEYEAGWCAPLLINYDIVTSA
ncbi:Hypothetical Protein FCC1311_074122 [Hondaea fermentalgiana]|uniref:Uncharacterized protein n=1 Tax=Hondaea fermentalgiana TaxID=2315210 RepID=A0A2R5GS64_9STRA|nr:Hypothetical Protein FCC1311_074122 [Hondaea fermentalgiana]|eukprot:GBG31191.1 Hypothetical Protein FCC1311_074122 [Hondaea fermentalgiana]